MNSNINSKLQALSKSKFRSSFKLDSKDLTYINKISLEKIKEHTKDFITKRLAPSEPINDGKQTPFKGHPVFKAQHATATCCRTCLMKWHDLTKNKELNEEEINYIVGFIMRWIELQIAN